MQIEISEILRLMEQQKAIFRLGIGSKEFNEGVMAGLDLVKAYLEHYEKQLGEDMAKHYEEGKRGE